MKQDRVRNEHNWVGKNIVPGVGLTDFFAVLMVHQPGVRMALHGVEANTKKSK